MSDILNTIGRTVFQLGFQISPIILTGNSQITSLIPGGMLPIVALTEAPSFLTGLLSGNFAPSLDSFFAHFDPLPGANIVKFTYGMYPFANQAVAANAVISEVLNFSYRMQCPVQGAGGYTAKLATFLALKAVLNLHSTTGGTYILVSPAFVETNCLLGNITDISEGASKQTQTAWRFDFIKPLITLEQAGGVLGSLMSKITSGLPTAGALSGPSTIAGNALSGAAAAVTSGAANLLGTSLPGFPSAAVLPVVQSALPSL